jgi:hypothetical protein
MNQYEALLNNTEQLRKQLENHQQLLQNAETLNGKPLDFCPHLQCPYERRLRTAIQDVIDTLEETRKAFKSKQLEQLRRRMLSVLDTPPL